MSQADYYRALREGLVKQADQFSTPAPPKNLTPRYRIRAGTRVEVSDMLKPGWRKHTTRQELGFERCERYANGYYEFREKTWVIRVYRSLVVHREDLL